MIILIHSSKTMRVPPTEPGAVRTSTPVLLDKALELVSYLRTLTPARLAAVMALSPQLAAKTHELYANWSHDAATRQPAVESFLGDIYSGLQIDTLRRAGRTFADKHLRILSGLYGILRPFDGISPYRLEMAYRLPDARYANLYGFWGSAIADDLPRSGPVINLAATEYSRAVVGFLDPRRIVTPKFLSVRPETGKPTFVAVQAKVARGAFARWLIDQRSKGDPTSLVAFAELGYRHDPALSTDREPCFVCHEFGGKGLSVRLR